VKLSRKGLLAALAVCGILVLAVWAWSAYRSIQLDRAYARAVGIAPYYKNQADSLDAVDQIGASGDRRRIDMLLTIAIKWPSMIGASVPEEAIHKLAESHDPRAGAGLSELLSTKEGLGWRIWAAEAIAKLPCNNLCLHRVLNYMARISSGERNAEDTLRVPAGFEEQMRHIAEEQQRVYHLLDSVILSDKDATVRVLEQRYGLGSSDPAAFAVDLAGRLDLVGACPPLQRSLNSARANSGSPEGVSRLESVVEKLKCR
jgi:hypothetical protein